MLLKWQLFLQVGRKNFIKKMIFFLLPIFALTASASSVYLSRDLHAWETAVSLCDARYGLAPLNLPIPEAYLPAIYQLLEANELTFAWLGPVMFGAPDDEENPFKPFFYHRPGDEGQPEVLLDNISIGKAPLFRVLCIKEKEIEFASDQEKIEALQWFKDSFIAQQIVVSDSQ
jgi:hypothetical protein